MRVGIDRDEDGFFDRDEIAAGSDPADPSSPPSGGTTSTVTSTTTSSTTSTSPPFSIFVPIPTTKLTMKDRSAFPSDPNRRKVSFKSSTKGVAFTNHITPPFNGAPNDPTVIGATIAVYNSMALGGELVVVGLPAAKWEATGPNSYKYKGASTEAITRVTLKPDLLQFKGGKAAWGYTLNEPLQGRVAAAMFVGNLFWCSDAPAKASGNPPSTANNDRVDKFVAQPKTPPPFFCPSP
jgi:hypothetical protein